MSISDLEKDTKTTNYNNKIFQVILDRFTQQILLIKHLSYSTKKK